MTEYPGPSVAPPGMVAAPARRPRTATIGAALSLTLAGLAFAVGMYGVVRSQGQSSRLTPGGEVVLLVIVGITLIGVIASIRTLQDSNAGRITAAALAVCVSVIAGLIFLGTLTSQTAAFDQDRAPVAVVIVSACWGALSGASAFFLLSGRADAWYVRRPSAAGSGMPSSRRGTTVIVLGVIGILTTFLTGILGAVFGVLAWSIASSELRQLRDAGIRDPDEATLRAGRTLGVISTAISSLGLAAIVVAVVLIGIHEHDSGPTGPTTVNVLPRWAA